jgi:methylated-DNA-[protein]-cysteine S-methyltransferase
VTAIQIPKTKSDTLRYDAVQSPIGRLILASDGTALVGVWMANASPRDASWSHHKGDDDILAKTREELEEYFDGRRRTFDVPLAPNGTEFQRSVWHALTEIPFGTTISYAELARRVGNEAAVRAVGAANGRNPIPVIVPCHRVIGSDGSLTGFGGGLPRKKWLLQHERALPVTQGELDV